MSEDFEDKFAGVPDPPPAEHGPCPNPDDPEYVVLWARYTALQDQVQAKEVFLQRKFGPQARLDQNQMLAVRLQMFMDHVSPVNTVERMAYEIKWMENLNDSLEIMHNQIGQFIKQQEAEAQAQANRNKLILPGGDFRLPGT